MTRPDDASTEAERERRSVRARLAAGFAVLIVAAACSPKYHTAAPYRFNPDNAREATTLAHERCAARDPTGAALPPRPFVTDGCSMWPDGQWQHCCVEHDMAYWCGGTREARIAADQRLRECVATSSARGRVVTAWAMKWGVRFGGGPLWPFHWRWGYGHAWPHWYGSQSDGGEN